LSSKELLKQCTKCGIEKSFSEFQKSHKGKFGLQAQCKDCRNSANRVYKQQNIEKVKAYNNEYNQAHKELRQVYHKKYYQKNLEKIQQYSSGRRDIKREYDKRRRESNLSEIREYDRYRYRRDIKKIKDRVHRYYINNKALCLQRCAQRYRCNKSIILAKYKIYHRKRLKSDRMYAFKCRLRNNISGAIRRGLKSGGLSKTGKSVEAILGCSLPEFKICIESQFTDGMSWELFFTGKLHIDHIVPIVLATTEEEVIKLNHYTNLQPLWAKDNLRKGARIG
jgi:predicted  nucleic acid-binding Zn-ribbon protein